MLIQNIGEAIKNKSIQLKTSPVIAYYSMPLDEVRKDETISGKNVDSIHDLLRIFLETLVGSVSDAKTLSATQYTSFSQLVRWPYAD